MKFYECLDLIESHKTFDPEMKRAFVFLLNGWNS